jgi:hypothetical protein
METGAGAITRDAGTQELFQTAVFGSDIREGRQIAAMIIQVMEVKFMTSMNSVG